MGIGSPSSVPDPKPPGSLTGVTGVTGAFFAGVTGPFGLPRPLPGLFAMAALAPTPLPVVSFAPPHPNVSLARRCRGARQCQLARDIFASRGQVNFAKMSLGVSNRRGLTEARVASGENVTWPAPVSTLPPPLLVCVTTGLVVVRGSGLAGVSAAFLSPRVFLGENVGASSLPTTSPCPSDPPRSRATPPFHGAPGCRSSSAGIPGERVEDTRPAPWTLRCGVLAATIRRTALRSAVGAGCQPPIRMRRAKERTLGAQEADQVISIRLRPS